MYFDRVRKEIGLTRRQIAKYVDVTAKDVKDWEDGKTLPPKEMWSKIEEIIKTPLDQVEFPKFHTLLEIRTELGLTQTQFGNLIGVSLTTVNRWEMGKSFPPKTKWKAIEEVLGIPFNQIRFSK